MSSKSMSSKSKSYVMYGYNKLNIDEVGYFGKNLQIVEDLNDAMIFKTKRNKRQKGFGSPEKWLNFLNDPNEELNHGFIFHLVAVTL